MPLPGEKRRDFVGALPDRGEGVEVAVRPDQRTAFGRAAGRRDFFQGLTHDRLVKDEIVRRIKDERGRLDFRRVDIGELVGLAQIEEVIGIGQTGTRGRRLVEKAFDLEFVVDGLGGPGSAGAVPNVVRAQFQLLACRVTNFSVALTPSSGGALPW